MPWSKTRASFHHFGTITHNTGIGNFSAKMPKIGNFLVFLAVCQIIKYIIYLSEFCCSVNLNHHCMMYYMDCHASACPTNLRLIYTNGFTRETRKVYYFLEASSKISRLDAGRTQNTHRCSDSYHTRAAPFP